MSWTDDRVEKLKSMWTEGMSASQIAKALGGVTRNAVIGKVHRLGLSNRTAAPKAATPDAPAAEVAAKPAAKPVEPVKTPVAAVPARKPLPPQPATDNSSPQPAEILAEMALKARKLNLLELTERTCKWPIGDPATDDFFFCGLPATPGKPYCETHVGVAFQPMSSRRERDRNRARN